MSIAKRIALVTGAAHGIGLEVARQLSLAGAKVAAVDKDEQSLSTADLPNSVERIEWNIGDDQAELIQEVSNRLDRPTLLFNNVGRMDGRSFLELPANAVWEAYKENVLGQWFLTRHFADGLIEGGLSGSVVFNLSLHATRVRMCPDYSTTKAALAMLVQELASELSPYHIRVNSISPGAIDTWSDRIREAAEHRKRSEAVVPMGRLGNPSDVAPAVVFLFDEERAGYITGADLRIDGGLYQYNWLHHLYGVASSERDITQDGV